MFINSDKRAEKVNGCYCSTSHKSITQPADNGLFAALSFINVALLPIAPKKKVLIKKMFCSEVCMRKHIRFVCAREPYNKGGWGVRRSVCVPFCGDGWGLMYVYTSRP